MSMKLSRRDQVIILIVLVVVVLGIGIFLLLKPKYQEVQESNDRLASKEAELSDIMDQVATLEPLKQQLEDMVNEVVESQDVFVSEREVYDSQHIITYVMDMLSETGIEIDSVNLDSVLSGGVIEPYTVRKNAVAYDMKISADLAQKLPEEVYYAYNNSYPDDPPKTTVGYALVTVNYHVAADQFESFYNAVQRIADNDKNIYLETCSAQIEAKPSNNSSSSDDGGIPDIEGSLVIDYYSIYPMDPADIEDDAETADTSAE